MKWQWIPLVAAALIGATLTAQAEDRPRALPVGAPTVDQLPVIHAPAAEPVAAPKSAPAAHAAPAVIMCDDCCPDQKPPRPRKERFNLCDYWEILCACFYRG